MEQQLAVMSQLEAFCLFHLTVQEHSLAGRTFEEFLQLLASGTNNPVQSHLNIAKRRRVVVSVVAAG